jgi:peptidoglycan/LPS O-acetylase OafA/YrhL
MIRPLPYRPEIDGLRTVAVLPVILFHAGFPVFSGGFVGVDVFFVISGYLITTIILREVAAGDFSVLRFYERRARRILPALFVVVLACVPFAFAWMLPWQFKEFGRSLIGVAAFASNILFWRASGYFAAAAEEIPLLHTWSLAVEEQFYIFFPLAVLLLWRLGRRAVVVAIVLVALASLGLSEWAWRHHAEANFYLLPTRAWELLAGALLAARQMNRPGQLPASPLAEVGGALGLALIVGAILGFDEATPLPGLWALVPVGGTVLVILCATPATWAGCLLSQRPMVAIGLISYSAYLWHQPLFAFARIRSIDTPGPLLMGGLALLALILAWATWRLVERPFRDPARLGRKRVFAFAGVGMIVLLIVGGGLDRAQGVPARFDEITLRAIATSREPGRGRQGCSADSRLPNEGCVFHPAFASRVLLWGDSHAMAIAETLAEGLAERGFGLEAILLSGCPPVLDVRPDSRFQCPDQNAATLRYIESAVAPDRIVMAARWSQAFEGVKFDNGEGGIDVAPQRIFRHLWLHDRPQPEIMAIALSETIEKVIATGKRLTIVGNVPEAGWNVPERLAKMRIYDAASVGPLSTRRDVFETRQSSSHAILQAFRDRGLIRLVEPSDRLCDAGDTARCRLVIDNVSMYRDNNHLSLAGARRITPEIVAAIVDDPARY